MDNLTLTTPRTKGPHVEHAQQLLNGHNRFKEDYLKGAVDGVFGLETARACKRAKYWLGYPASKIHGIYGETFDEYLRPLDAKGARRLSLAMALRRKVRLRRKKKRQGQETAGEKALRLAKTQIGVVESPMYSNRVIYTQWYGFIGPWCAMFVSWCFSHTGRPMHEALVENFVYEARNGQNGLTVTHDPVPGNIVCYDFYHVGTSDHCGIFEAWVTKGSSFLAIEGNTSGTSSQSNGGEVMRKLRYTYQVREFVRVSK